MSLAPRAFISFDFDHDQDQKTLFAGQSNNSKVPFTIQDWSSKEALPQSTWEKTIADKIGRCNMVIVLVGRSMRSATGVVKEIQMAAKSNVPVFGVYVDSANFLSNLPEGLPRHRVVDWSWEAIASKVQQMMNEGKNGRRY